MVDVFWCPLPRAKRQVIRMFGDRGSDVAGFESILIGGALLSREATLLQLRRHLTEKFQWFETALAELARLDGFGDLPKPLVQLCAQIGREPVRVTELAKRLGTSRQWIIRLGRDGEQRGILAVTDDAEDRRAMRVGFSDSGWKVVHLAVGRMQQIERELARRIGAAQLEQLVELLSLDWGSPFGVDEAGDGD